jgi:hypothetical protein
VQTVRNQRLRRFLTSNRARGVRAQAPRDKINRPTTNTKIRERLLVIDWPPSHGLRIAGRGRRGPLAADLVSPSHSACQTSESTPGITFHHYISPSCIISRLIILYKEIDQSATHLRIDFPQ